MKIINKQMTFVYLLISVYKSVEDYNSLPTIPKVFKNKETAVAALHKEVDEYNKSCENESDELVEMCDNNYETENGSKNYNYNVFIEEVILV